MLGLPYEVAGDDSCVGRFVSDDGYLSRAGKDVDADLPKKHALGLGHVFIAGATMMSAGLPANSPYASVAIACTRLAS